MSAAPRVLVAMIAALCGASSALAAEPAPAERVAAGFADDPSCQVASLDGDAAGMRIVALLACAGGKAQALLIAGAYPVPNSARPANYQLLDRRVLAAGPAVRPSLANGSCSVGRRAIEGSSVIVANWRGRSRVSGKQIAELWLVSPDGRTLVRRPVKSVTCYSDQP